METVRIGFVGCGGVCRLRHLPGLRRIPGVEFVVVSNRSRESSEEVAQEAEISEVADSWREVVHHPGVDAVVIGTWPYLHHNVSVAALKAGKHVFCQARMAMNAREALEMREAARASGRVAALCPVPFGLSINKTMRRFHQDGRLGNVYLVQVQSHSDANLDPSAPLSWRKDHRLSGLNVLTLGMYVEVIHRWFGPTRQVMAASQIFTPLRREHSGGELEIKIPDQVQVNSVLHSGAAVHYDISGMARIPRETITIHGSRASLHYDVSEDVLYWLRGKMDQIPVEILPEDRYDTADWTVEQDFIDAIRKGKHCHPDFEDGCQYMRVVDAVAESAAQGRVVELAEDLD